MSPYIGVIPFFGWKETKKEKIFVFLLLFHVKRKGIILTENGILCIFM